MGFFKNLKAANRWKSGKKHVDTGNLSKALVYFDDASRMANDQKTLFEFRAWFYLTKAIHQCEQGELNAAQDSYDKFMSDFHNFHEECTKTPGVGTNARFNLTKDSLMQLSTKYTEFLEKIHT